MAYLRFVCADVLARANPWSMYVNTKSQNALLSLTPYTHTWLHGYMATSHTDVTQTVAQCSHACTPNLVTTTTRRRSSSLFVLGTEADCLLWLT